MDTAMPRPRRRARLLGATAVTSGLLAFGAAGQAMAVSLTPSPPSFERCHPAGDMTICEGNQTYAGGIEGTGITCGSGADSFEIFDVSSKVLEHGMRWYDGNGNLTRRVNKLTWLGSSWTNPLTGNSVAYRQTNVVTDDLAVPGDVGTAVETTTGVVNFIIPGRGAIAQDVGRTVFGFDGSLEFSAGPHVFVDYFVNGDTTALDSICAVLAGD
jgi:hypothetical protein